MGKFLHIATGGLGSSAEAASSYGFSAGGLRAFQTAVGSLQAEQDELVRKKDDERKGAADRDADIPPVVGAGIASGGPGGGVQGGGSGGIDPTTIFVDEDDDELMEELGINPDAKRKAMDSLRAHLTKKVKSCL